MPTSQEVSTQINQTTRLGQQAMTNSSSQAYRNLSGAIQKLEAAAREAFQAKLQNRYRPILQKLEDGQPLSGDELKTVKLLIVGEANYYLEHENDLSNWQQELQRLLAEVEKLCQGNLEDIETLMQVRALCQEAMRAVPDLVYYYEQEERVRRFEQATKTTIDPQSGQVLAEVIREMMISDKL